jgi:hypothetical protein
VDWKAFHGSSSELVASLSYLPALRARRDAGNRPNGSCGKNETRLVVLEQLLKRWELGPLTTGRGKLAHTDRSDERI